MPIADEINVKFNLGRKVINHVLMLLDETGSMSSVRDKTLDGVNEYINGLKQDKGDDVIFTLVKFDSTHYTPVYKETPIKDVSPLTEYNPGAMTNLLDSIGKIITTCDETKADNHLCVVMTDGLENASQEFKLASIKSLIEQKKKQDKPWNFTFLGAEIDAYAEASPMGFSAGSTVSYNKGSTETVFNTLARSQGAWRSAGVVGQSMSDGELYSKEEKAKMEKKD